MIDMSVPKIPLELENDMTHVYSRPVLPDGWSLANYKSGSGMEKSWAEIMRSVGFFPTEEKGEAEFIRDFLRFPDEAEKRVFFLISPDGVPAGSCSAWFEDPPDGGKRFSKLHWLGLRPDCQGRGLGRALVENVLFTFQSSGARPVFLDTQTTSHRAICLYMSEGFYPLAFHHRTGEKSADFESARAVLKGAMKDEYYKQFCETAR